MIVTQTCTKRKHWNPIRGTAQPVDTWTLNTSSKKCASGTRIIQASNCISWFFLRVSEHRNLHSMVTAQSFSYFISSSSLLGMQVVWWNESKWTLSILLILCGTLCGTWNQHEPKLLGAAGCSLRCEARCCCSCFSSADRASCSFWLSWAGELIWDSHGFRIWIQNPIILISNCL